MILKSIFCILTVLTTTFCGAKDFTKCVIYQFSGKDSTKKHIAIVQTFNRRGQIISETYSNYKKNSKEGNSDGTYYYYYTDTLLTKQLFIDNKKDTTKILYYYNPLNQCIKQEHFSCEKRLKKDVKRDVVFDEDFEKDRTWMKTNEVTFSYDGKGRKIKRTDMQDYTRLWKYDEQNRIVQEKGYNSDRVAYVEDYMYFKGGYKYSTAYYDNNGKPEPPTYSDIEFSPIFTSTFYLDKSGRIVKAETTTEKGVKISNETTLYDTKGRIIRTYHEYLDEHFVRKDDPSEITHIFQYK